MTSVYLIETWAYSCCTDAYTCLKKKGRAILPSPIAG
nr:MAG TPA: hypothetical protein [Caudoviricetes sp.]